MFERGRPACPVACTYCHVTEHEVRRAEWNAGPRLGVNRACTFVNVAPWEDASVLDDFPWEVLRGDHVGFTAVTDPLWPRLNTTLRTWIDGSEQAGARLLTVVTKWPRVSASAARLLADHRVMVVYGVGNEAVERSTLVAKQVAVAHLLNAGVEVLPTFHPYIPGVTSLAILPELVRLGVREVDVKGFRWDPAMRLPTHPQFSADREVLVEDGWRERVVDAGMSLLSPREWYLREAPRGGGVSHGTALAGWTQVSALALVASSSEVERVRDAYIHRRTL